MFKLFMAACMLLSTSLLAQEYSLTGNIRDAKNQQKLIGATVRIAETNLGTTTDELGQFYFSALQPGQYTLLISYVGYQNKSEVVQLQQNANLSITLDEAIVIGDEVVVLATRADEKTPATFTNIDKKNIQKQNFGQDLPFL